MFLGLCSRFPSVAVSPGDFPPPPDGSAFHILLNGRYVFSAQAIKNCPPGEIGLTDAQRTWTEIALAPGTIVETELYDGSDLGGNGLLGGIEVEIGFESRKTTETPYDQEELAAQFKRVMETS